MKVVLAFALVFTACHLRDPVEPTPNHAEVCERFCEKLELFECPGREGSPGPDELLGNSDDIPCSRVCRDILASGVYGEGDLQCMERVENCDQAETCLLERGP